MLKKNCVNIFGVLAILAGLGIAAFLSSDRADAKEASSQSLLAAPTALKIDIAEAMKERVLGDEKAPVTIIEYASMTCKHCAQFATKVLPEVKKRLIDTGKAKLIFRDFPLDNLSLKAAMMNRCVPADRYYNLIDVVFSNQERWVHAKEPLESLAQLGALAGMDHDYFDACTNNKELETAILDGVQQAQRKYRIKSTPTFVFNDGAVIFSGALDADKFETTVNKLTKGK